jgi:DnaJ-class molecular chaperone
MSDSFNIKKFLAENEDPFLATLKKNQRGLTGLEPEFQPSPCTACDGTGRLDGDEEFAAAECPYCDGAGELVEHNGDHYDDMEFGGGDYAIPTNICPDCEGSGKDKFGPCERCEGHGEVFESSDEQNVEHSDQMDDEDYDVPAMEGYEFGDIVSGYDPRLIAQDMIDGGMTATSDANFDDLYAHYMGRNGDPATQYDYET